tara:strand:- start:4947 stop:5189 length:243 start_codon:yes stop_codon:yes gene_type:complete
MPEQISGQISSVSREGLNFDVTFLFNKKGKWHGELISSGFVEPYIYNAKLDSGSVHKILVTKTRSLKPGCMKSEFVNYVC